jgi:hypothetical protein
MKKISKWASVHIYLARTIIVAGHFILCILAYFLVKNLNRLDYDLPPTGIHIIIFIAIFLCLFYPSKSGIKSTFSFLKTYGFRKICDFIFLVLSFITFIFFFAGKTDFNLQDQVTASTITGDSVHFQYKKTSAILGSLSHRDKHSLTRSEKKVLVKEFRYQSKQWAHSKFKQENENGDAALQIILIILLALGLIFLLSILACSIACAGLEILAVIVAIVGLAAIIWIAAILIGKVNKKKAEKSISIQVNTE